MSAESTHSGKHRIKNNGGREKVRQASRALTGCILHGRNCHNDKVFYALQAHKHLYRTYIKDRAKE